MIQPRFPSLQWSSYSSSAHIGTNQLENSNDGRNDDIEDNNGNVGNDDIHDNDGSVDIDDIDDNEVNIKPICKKRNESSFNKNDGQRFASRWLYYQDHI